MASHSVGENWAKRRALLASAILVVIVLAPVVRNFDATPTDGFPLSHYAMFTKKRGETTTLYYLVGLRHDGTTIRLPAALAGSGGMNSVRKQIRRMCQLGKADELASTVHKKLAERGQLERHGIREVHVVKAKFSIQRYALGDSYPLNRRSLGSAPSRKEASQ